MSLRVAAAQAGVFTATHFDDIARRIETEVAEAVANQARLLVFPEYHGMLLTGLGDAAMRADLHGQIAQLQQQRDAWLALHRGLARQYGIYLLAGSLPWREGADRYVNRAWLCSPEGACAHQDKQVMTRFEREQWCISPGGPLRVFDTDLGCIGVNLCYDVEFPLIARSQAVAGAQLLLVPSCTDTRAGYWRVRVGAQARALENQCIAVQAPLVGRLDWSPAVDVNLGAAGFYGPPDRGFPDDGVLSAGTADVPGWLIADLDLAAVDTVRGSGQVFNHRHWDEQIRGLPALAAVERVRL